MSNAACPGPETSGCDQDLRDLRLGNCPPARQSYHPYKTWSCRDIVSAKASDRCQGNTPQPHHTGRFDHRRVLSSVCRLSSSLRRLFGLALQGTERVIGSFPRKIAASRAQQPAKPITRVSSSSASEVAPAGESSVNQAPEGCRLSLGSTGPNGHLGERFRQDGLDVADEEGFQESVRIESGAANRVRHSPAGHARLQSRQNRVRATGFSMGAFGA